MTPIKDLLTSSRVQGVNFFAVSKFDHERLKPFIDNLKTFGLEKVDFNGAYFVITVNDKYRFLKNLIIWEKLQ